MTDFPINKLRFENMSFRYVGGDPLFNHVDLEVPLDQTTWLRGERGAGRSTCLQMLAGLLVPTQGALMLNDLNVADMSFEEFLPYRQSIGYGFDTGGLIHNRSLIENLTLPLLYHKVLPPDQALDRAAIYLKDFDLWKDRDAKPSAVTGTKKKLVCLIRAIIQHPQMLLLDDPTVGLTQDVSLQFFDLVQVLRETSGLRHVVVTSFDEKFMSLLDHASVHIEEQNLYRLAESTTARTVAA